MKPVAILRFAPHEGPGYFATYLERARVPFHVIGIGENVTLPALNELGGLGLMGGPMSVNDDLPWIAPVLQLIRDCVATEVPVIGHCLGGQLMSRALGGVVTRNPVKEIGWGDVRVLHNEQAQRWFGPVSPGFLSFHWHGETFSIPPHAVRVLESAHCPNQAYVFGTLHLAMQCHIEMTPEMIANWCVTGAREIERHATRSPAVQREAEMKVDMDARIAGLRRAADAVYAEWVKGLTRE